MNASGREKLLLQATVAVVALGIAYFLLFKPAWTRWEEIQEQRQTIRQKTERIRDLIKRRPEVQEEIHNLEERITSSAPETLESEFNVYLERVAERAGVTPSSVKMLRQRPLRDDFAEIVLDVNLDCDLARLTDYLLELEKKADRLVKISRLTVAQTGGRSRAAPLSAQMTLSTVVKSEPEETAEEGAGEGGQPASGKGGADDAD